MSAQTLQERTEQLSTLTANWKANACAGVAATGTLVAVIIDNAATSDLPVSTAGLIATASFAIVTGGYTLGAWIIMHIYRAATIR